MKAITFISVALLFLAGCTAPLVDAEFGKAQQTSWSSQQLPDESSPPLPEGTDGILAEEIMKAFTRTYAEKREKTNIIRLGIANQSQGK